MNRLMPLAVTAALLAGPLIPVDGAQWYVATDGRPDGRGSKTAPWDLASALAGRQPVGPGDTVWIQGGTYKHPQRNLGSPGYVVRLAGAEDKPIHVRAVRGQRVTVDGGLTVQPPSTWLWIRDLEILVSENFSMSRTLDEPGSHPTSYNRPHGGLNIHAGERCKFINLVIHDNAQGISWWRGSTDSEVYGCILYDNGWDAPDRGHGHAIYTQNQTGLKTIADCMMTGGYGYTMHAYGSSRAYVDNYLVEGNIGYDGGPFLIGGGRPSRNIRVVENYLYQISMRIGYSAPYNENCEIRDNVIARGRLEIRNYRKVRKQGNRVLGKNDPRPEDPDASVILRPNRYDPDRAHVAIFNWAKNPAVDLAPEPFLEVGDAYRLVDPRQLFGKPAVAGRFDGKAIRVPVEGEFAAFVLLRQAGCRGPGMQSKRLAPQRQGGDLMMGRFGYFVVPGILACFGHSLWAAAGELPQPRPVPAVQVIPLPYDRASFRHRGRELARYHFGPSLKRPFWYPIVGPAGRSLTRMGHPRDPQTHSHHNSVWISHHDVDGVDFWGDSGKGRIVHQRVVEYHDGPTQASMLSQNAWQDDRGRRLMREWRRVGVEPLGREGWLMLIDLNLEAPPSGPVRLGQTPFGIIGVRMAKTIGVHDGGGRIRNSEGQINEEEVFRKPARWVDYSGPVTDQARGGVTLMDHPFNPDHPTPFHVRDDGWMGACLTLARPLSIRPGKPLQLRYGLWVHAGVPKPHTIEEQYQQFIRREPPPMTSR